ncbi:Ldh family oxidoreductase [Microbacterium sp. NPDC089696]|uniref:Ldh family oxidoreductase n=1 Tax=Microbacterium sp. NPDC089696 TaxID=3364199 RepID=UPI003829106E
MIEQQATREVVVSAAEMEGVIAAVLRAHGATSHDATRQAQMLVEGELRGQPSHGVRRLPVLSERLRNGVSTSGMQPVVTWKGHSRVDIDGQACLGPVVAHHAMDLIVSAAREHGIAVASIRNAGHIGMLAPYVEHLATQSCVGVVLTVSEALVAPHGGSRAMVGTNPIGIGVPTADDPLILDMSTAAVSAGKVLDYAARGQALPSGWAVDAAGQPTTDAVAATMGAISAFGGAKGYALGVALELLVGVLAGSAFGRDVSGTLDVDLPPTKGDVFIAIPVQPDSPALSAAAAYLSTLRQEGAPGSPVLIPGDRARQLRAKRLEHGIPVDAQLWDQILELHAASSRSTT